VPSPRHPHPYPQARRTPQASPIDEEKEESDDPLEDKELPAKSKDKTLVPPGGRSIMGVVVSPEGSRRQGAGATQERHTPPRDWGPRPVFPVYPGPSDDMEAGLILAEEEAAIAARIAAMRQEALPCVDVIDVLMQQPSPQAGLSSPYVHIW